MRPSDRRTTSRRRVLAMLGAGAPAVLAGCTGQDSEEVEYQEGGTVDLPTPAAGNGTNASEALAANEYAEVNGNQYAVELAALELRDHELVVKDDYRGVVVEGTATNTGEESIEHVEVRVRIYDIDGNHLGRYLDSTGDLAAGSTWSFDVIVLEDPGNIGSYEIAVLGAYG